MQGVKAEDTHCTALSLTYWLLSKKCVVVRFAIDNILVCQLNVIRTQHHSHAFNTYRSTKPNQWCRKPLSERSTCL